jgi:hypothetical protein
MVEVSIETEMKYGIRNSKMFLNEVYFWTDTINHWKDLLKNELYKNVIDCWRELVRRKKIVILNLGLCLHRPKHPNK